MAVFEVKQGGNITKQYFTLAHSHVRYMAIRPTLKALII